MSGYYARSIWPVECGNPERTKVTERRLDLRPGEGLAATARDTGRWNVMFVWRDPGELFLFGTTQLADPEPYSWVERVDPLTLAATASSARLPTGGHIWCGAVSVQANGDLYTVSGNYMHRLSPSLEVRAERRLSPDAAHNGFLILPDGNLLTKDLRLRGDCSTFTLLEPERLEVVSETKIEEPSMGRIAASVTRGVLMIYAPGDAHVLRYAYVDGALQLDRSWMPPYRDADDGEHGRAWDTTIADGGVWLHDNGDTAAVHQIHAALPAGSKEVQPAANAFNGAVRLLRIDEADAAVVETTIGDEGSGWVVAPPLYAPGRGIAAGFDSGAGVVAGYESRRGALRERWRAPVRNLWQPMLFADGMLVLDDYRPGEGDDNIVLRAHRDGFTAGQRHVPLSWYAA
jgi:hypothetical protein